MMQYVAPECELLVLVSESFLLSSLDPATEDDFGNF